MKDRIPKYIENAIVRRQQAAADMGRYDDVIVTWCEARGIEIEYSLGHVEVCSGAYNQIDETKDQIMTALMDKRMEEGVENE